jgi:hypothetical protein
MTPRDDLNALIGRRLKKVIPVGSYVGNGATLVSVELYGDCLVVRWLMVDRDVANLPPHVNVNDNIGTSYRRAGGAFFGNAPVVRGESLFTPAPPATADTLEVTIEGESIVLST